MRSIRPLIGGGLLAIVLLATVALSSPLPGTAASFTANTRTSGNVVGTAALTKPRITSVDRSDNVIGLSWQPTFDLEAAITYTVERSVSGGAPTTIYTGLLPSFVDRGNFPMQARTITKVAAGENHSLGLDDAGDVWAWGSHSSGQLGNPTSEGATPQQVLFPGGAVITDIAAGSGFSLAVGSGTVWGWGKNSSGQLGTGDSKQRSVPAVATTTEGLMACPIGSVPVDDGSACSLVSGTMYDYTVTTTLGRWTASSGVASVRAGTP